MCVEYIKEEWNHILHPHVLQWIYASAPGLPEPSHSHGRSAPDEWPS